MPRGDDDNAGGDGGEKFFKGDLFTECIKCTFWEPVGVSVETGFVFHGIVSFGKSFLNSGQHRGGVEMLHMALAVPGGCGGVAFEGDGAVRADHILGRYVQPIQNGNRHRH